MRLPIKASGWLALLLAGFCAIYNVGYAQTQVSRTKHNLTPSGPGSVKNTEPVGLCVYCHTPHNAKPTIGLWYREMSLAT